MVNKVEKANFSKYLSEARSWETNKYNELEKSRKLAWMVATGAGVITFLSVIALAMLTPLKTAVPFVVRVDNATGAVDVVSALSNAKTNYDEVMNKYHLQQYVRWREGYAKSLIGEYYKNVGLMSSRNEQSKYSQLFAAKNPQSPLKIYGDNGKSTITIKSVSFLKDNIALVRYTKLVENAANEGLTHWAATVVFTYLGTPMTEQDRAVNPLGFQVLEYRNDPDQAAAESFSLPAVSKSGTLTPQDIAKQFNLPPPAAPSATPTHVVPALK